MNQSTAKVENFDRGARLRSERERLGLSLVDLGKKTGVSKGSQILYEKGRPPTADYLVALGNLGADIIYILTGKRVEKTKPRIGTQVRRKDGSVLATYTGEASQSSTAPEPSPTQPDMIFLPVYDEVHASAGPGAVPVHELADGVLALGRRFLRDLGAVPERCVVIWAKGDSMTPTFPDGSALVVDRSQIELADGCILVFGIGDSLLVKRVQLLIGGEIRLTSDNHHYEPQTLGPHQLEQLRVIGRVVYFGRTP